MMIKMAKCSRCGLERVLVAGYTLCEKCFEHNQQLKFDYRDKRDEKIESELKKGNLNYGMKPVNDNPSINFSDFRKYFPNATWEDYQKEMARREEERRLEVLDDDLETAEYKRQILCVKAPTQDCIEYRVQRMGFKDKDPIFWQQHVNCIFCERWLLKWKKKFQIRGASPWA